jgi:CcmD family protein
MLDFMTEHQMYIVLSIVLLVWAGIVFYLVRLDRKISRLEETLKKES